MSTKIPPSSDSNTCPTDIEFSLQPLHSMFAWHQKKDKPSQADDLTGDEKSVLLRVLGHTEVDNNKGVHDWLLKIYRSGLGLCKSETNVHDLHRVETDAVECLRKGWPLMKRYQVRPLIQEKHKQVDKKDIDQMIDLGIRTWFMLDCYDDGLGYPRKWPESQSLQDLVKERFPSKSEDASEPIRRFPRRFRAVDLEVFGAIHVKWTSFLDEHLRFDEDNRTVAIFDRKDWLVDMLPRRSEQTSGEGEEVAPVGVAQCCESKTFSNELLQETIKTLDVLFPHWHIRTVEFLEREGRDFHKQSPFTRDTPKLKEFSYWRERLVDLIVEYQSPPLDWKRIWKDRRNPMAFWTFWIGIVIFFSTLAFGLVNAVFAGVNYQLAEAAAVRAANTSSTAANTSSTAANTSSTAAHTSSTAHL